MKSLDALECLFVTSKSAMAAPRDRRLDSSLGTFLNHVFSTGGTGYGLPMKLVSLTLIDEDFVREEAPTFDSSPYVQMAPQLRHLCVDVDNPITIREILRCLPSAAIRTLSTPSAWRAVRDLDINELAERDYTQHINHFIYECAEAKNLDEMVLLGAWEAHTYLVTKLNTAWDSTYSISELVLGTKEPAYYGNERNSCLWKAINWCDINTIRHSLYGYRCPDFLDRWGHELQRLRIDHVNIEELNIEEIGCLPSKNSLRILMLSPRSFGSKIIGVEEPACLESFPEGRFALAISQFWFPALRVLVLNGYRFWLELPDRETQSSAVVKVWHFITAQFDTIQSVEIQKWITPRDRKFLSDMYPSGDGNDHSSEWEQMDMNEPTLEAFRIRNFMVMLPVEDVGKEQMGGR
ncbi:hypothetical protein MMC11_004194 [Xylographa trunciseda]|nr:hypothetical protein [Xylographa trunciseda]